MKNFLEWLLSNLSGEQGKNRRIVAAALIAIVLLLLIYLMVCYGEFISGFVLLYGLVKLCRQDSVTNVPQSECCPLYNLIRSCLFEAVSVSADSTGLKCPVSEAGLDTIQYPIGSDGIQRFEYFIRLSTQSLNENQIDSAFIKEVLSTELNHSFQQGFYLFGTLCSRIQGLYIERLSAKAGGFIIVIIPVCENTLSYVDRHKKQQLIQDINQPGLRRPQDDLF